MTRIDSRAVVTFEGVEGMDLQHLEARRSRGGRSRASRKRPAKKRPTKKKSPAKKKKKPTKKKTPTKKKKPTKKRPSKKKPATKCTAAMKKAGKCPKKTTKKCTAAMKKAGKCPATKCTAAQKKAGKCPTGTQSARPTKTSAAACKYTPKGRAGSKTNSNTKLHARVDPDPCRTPDENDRVMIENYKIAAKAAAKKSKLGRKHELKVNQMYLFLTKQGPAVGPKHHAVIVGKILKVGNQLGMEATLQQLGKPADAAGNVVRHENAKFFCGSAFGGVCNTGAYRRFECGRMQAKFKLVGAAGVEFADPEHFIQMGEEVFMAEKPYNVLTWNCQVYAKKLINVTQLKKGQIATLTDAQARPSRPIDESDSESDWSYDPGWGNMGGFRVMNGDPEPYNRETNNGERFEID